MSMLGRMGRFLTYMAAAYGFYVATLSLAGSMGIGNFYMYYGPRPSCAHPSPASGKASAPGHVAAGQDVR